MNSDDIKIFFELLNDDEYCLLYNGNFIDAVTSKIITITKVSLIQRGDLIKTQNRFSYLIAECFQNIIRHGGHKERALNDEPLPGFFMAKIRNGYYDLLAGNLIGNENIPPLQKQFDAVNALTHEELKALYNKTLAEGELSDKGGAGLGIIDMARKTSQKLEYKFFDADNQKSMFYQRVVMTNESETAKQIGIDSNIDFGIELHKSMIDRNVLVLQKSDFSRDSFLPMLKIVEENVISTLKDTTFIKIIYQILIELIQNVNHSDFKLKNRKEGVFLIAKDERNFSICLGYYVDNKKIDWLNYFIKAVQHMNNDELEKSYLHRLKTFDNLGIEPLEGQIFDFGRIIKDRFSFNLYEVDQNISFFSIYALI